MQFQASRTQPKTKSPGGGLDSGPGGEGRKRKRDANDGGNGSTGQKKEKPTPITEEKGATGPKTEIPKILPGEKLSDFSARVDRELPLAAMKRSAKPTGSDLAHIREERQTKHEKRLRRLQREWREEEAAIREREEEEREEAEENMEDELQLWKQWEAETGKNKKKGAVAKKNKRRNTGQNGSGSDSDDDDPDPWAKLNKRDRSNRPVNPFDVAQAPPQLTKPKGKFKVRGGAKVDVANVPAAVGSLRRREELASERRNIVEEYRRLMAEKRK